MRDVSGLTFSLMDLTKSERKQLCDSLKSSIEVERSVLLRKLDWFDKLENLVGLYEEES